MHTSKNYVTKEKVVALKQPIVDALAERIKTLRPAFWLTTRASP